ncbi:MAG: NADH-quinone oxidoreductase subunit NuoF [Clostridiaceae bacterium]|nr:NADH-quinone oxidoreductase subunit NuoF [Clostridiaceae bacterium]
MIVLNTYEDLRKAYEELSPLLNKRREGHAGIPTPHKRELLVCGGTGCHSSESLELMQALQAAVDEQSIDAKVVQVGCFGFCAQGPIVQVMPDNVFYVQVKMTDIPDIIETHLKGGEPIERLLFVDPASGEVQHDHASMAFYEKQERISLRNCGLIDPESFEECLAAGGYLALAQALETTTPDQVVQVIKDSGLRGRGGGGFPTGLKWDLCRRSPGTEKYVICNADEGDPGAFMDRSILEGDPHSIVEAMIIAGYAIGANDGLIYIRAEYPLAVNRLRIAIREAEEAQLLGDNILGSGFNFHLRIVLGAGAFVCGEETALIRSCEGHRGEPTRKPPFPAQSGFRGKPTNVNNVETLVNIPIILTKGADWYSSIGTESSKGTKVFALAGTINNIGLVEVPMGTTLREIIYDIGGGIPNNKAFKAVQTGGPSGGVITEADLDTPIDYESLKKIGSMMGSGGMIVMDEDNDMVDIARFYLEFTTAESCGKCTPCRVGTTRIHEMLETLLAQEGDEMLLTKLHNLCLTVEDTALCALGQTAPNPVLSTMKYFPEEYLRYARREVKKSYWIDPEVCIGCTKCKRVCPVECITGSVKKAHVIDENACIACGACAAACPVQAIHKPK